MVFFLLYRICFCEIFTIFASGFGFTFLENFSESKTKKVSQKEKLERVRNL